MSKERRDTERMWEERRETVAAKLAQHVTPIQRSEIARLYHDASVGTFAMYRERRGNWRYLGTFTDRDEAYKAAIAMVFGDARLSRR